MAGVPLAVGELFGTAVLDAVVTGGPLRLSNNAAAAIDVAVLVSPVSARRMSVAVAPSLAQPGQPVTITATLTEVDGGDAPRAQLVDASGTVVADVALAAGSGGMFSTTLTPGGAGEYQVVAAVGGSRPRSATTVLTVVSGGARVGSGLSEQLPDDNGNGLHDALVVRVPVSVAAPGRYRIAARLADSTGATVTAAGEATVLEAGAQTVDVRFDGLEIFRSGMSGPYQVVDVALSRDDAVGQLEDFVAVLGTTAAHDHRSFEHFRVEIDLNGFSDSAADVNSDGLLDVLTVKGSARVDRGTVYAVNDQRGRHRARRLLIYASAASQPIG